jgi:hypothetical protein
MKPGAEQRIAIAIDELQVGDVVAYTAAGGPAWIDLKVIGLLHGRGGRLIGFFPAAALDVDPAVAIELKRVSKAWRIVPPKRDAAEATSEQAPSH